MSLEPKEFLEKRTLERLDSNDPTMQDLANGIKMLLARLWTKEELDAQIIATHNRLCMSCPRTAQPAGQTSAAQPPKKIDPLCIKLAAIISSLIVLLETLIAHILRN